MTLANSREKATAAEPHSTAASPRRLDPRIKARGGVALGQDLVDHSATVDVQAFAARILKAAMIQS